MGFNIHGQGDLTMFLTFIGVCLYKIYKFFNELGKIHYRKFIREENERINDIPFYPEQFLPDIDCTKESKSIDYEALRSFMSSISFYVADETTMTEEEFEKHLSEQMQLGAFVIDKEDVNITDPAIVVFVHTEVPTLRTIRHIHDGALSNRDVHELTKISAFQFCQAWSSDKINYTNYKETQ